MASALAGGVVIAGFIGINKITMRVEQVTAVAEALAQGEQVRTGMQATDEVGAVGAALDHYATVTREREDHLRSVLHRQRRESNYLLAILEAIPDGVLVQDTDGQVMLINEQARELLGKVDSLQDIGVEQLNSTVSEFLGEAIAPGLYALGDPKRVNLDGRMLSAQAAAITSPTRYPLGTVVVVRDITEEVEKEQAQEQLLGQLSDDIRQSFEGLAQAGRQSPNILVQAFARELSRHAASLQKMIVDMRELTRYGPEQAERVQRPLRLETILWAVANDWRQIAQAAGLSLHIIIEQKGCMCWAMKAVCAGRSVISLITRLSIRQRVAR